MHSIESLERSIPIHLRKAAKWADKGDYKEAGDHITKAAVQIVELSLMKIEAASGACEVE